MRRTVKVALVAATLIAPAREALPATITVHEPDGQGRVFVDIVGTIDDEDFKTFKEKTDQFYLVAFGHPKKQVIVTLISYGGKTYPALQIGDRIRRTGMYTFVPADRTCTSACALIWLAGASRTVGDTPQIGFHAAYDPKTKQATGAGNAVVGAYLRDLAIGYKAIEFMTRKGPTSVEWLTPDLAKEFGIAWAMLQPSRAIPIPPQPKWQPRLQAPPQVISAWSKSARSLASQQLPSATVPTSPNLKLLPVRPVMPSPEAVPRETPPTTAPPDQIEPGSQTSKPVPSPEPPAKVEEPPLAARPKITDRFDPGGQPAPATSAPGAQPAVPTAQKVVLYEEDPADPNGKRFVGSAIWRTEMVTPAFGGARELAIRADIEVPERKLAVTWSLRRNTDKGLPATHTVEIFFKLPADFPTGGISNVPGILMKQAESTRGVPLAGLAVKVTPGFYMIGLSNLDADKARNLELLNERGWIDIPVVYNNNRRAILAMEKGTPGERVFAEAFKAWK
jgi:hypothetical protein